MLVSYFYQGCKINDFGLVQAMVSMGKVVLGTKKTETITWTVVVRVMVLMMNSMFYLQILMIIASVMNLLSCIKRTLASSVFSFFDCFFIFLSRFTS